MAFTTTQTLDNVLLRNISFRTTANNAISSTYGLYANGQGQTYWSNTVSPRNLSTLSTSLSLAVIDLSTTISTTNANTNANLSSIVTTLGIQSTQISTLNYALLSSVNSLVLVDKSFSNSVVSLSNQYFALSNSLALRVDNIYTSTTNMFYSTLYGYSSFSTFYTEIAAVQSSVNTSVSSLSTALSLQNISTYNSLTANYILADSLLAVSTTNYINQQISSLSSVIATDANLSTFSSIITQQLLSTSAGNISSVVSAGTVLAAKVSTIYNSSIKYLESTNVTNTSNISSLLNLSTQLSTISHYWISSFVSTNDYYQNLTINSNLSNLSTSVSSIWASSLLLTYAFSTISSIYKTDFTNQQSTNAGLQSNISSLQREFSVLTTSSILANVYDTFNLLAEQTSTLVNSTILTTAVFQQNLYYSTTLQNTSISKSYFNFYVSTLYASTLSTLIPSTFSYMSTLVSTLYSTGLFYLISTLGSTSQAIKNQFLSTTSSLTNSIILSTQDVANSSIIGYVLLPTAVALSSFSTSAGRQLSTFSTTGMSQLSTQSSLFNTLYTSTAILYISTVNLYTSFSSLYSTSVVQAGTLFSTFSTQSYQLLSTQNAQFNSTIAVYPQQLSTAVGSTNVAIASTTLVAANATLAVIEVSTLAAYNVYASSLLAASSSIGLSTLFTVQNINLAGSTFSANLDMASYRNFNVNVYNLSNGDYQLNYDPNVLAFLDYRRGVITLNISTVGQSSKTNLLHFNVYRWGMPTTVFGNIYPYISNADYSLQYEYTIINRMIYANLLNVFPHLAIQNTQVVPITPNVKINGSLSSNYFWRGTPVRISWSNYSFFPFGQVGAPPFDPEVEVDVIVNGSVVQQYFAPFTQSSITIQAPYLKNQTSPLITTSVRSYIVGDVNNVQTNSFVTVLPTFDTIYLRSPGYPVVTGFVGGQELVSVSDSGKFALNGLTPTMFITNSSNYKSFNNDPIYSANNLLNGILNTAGARGYTPSTITVGPSNVVGQFQEMSLNSGYPDFYINLPGYFAPLNRLQTFNSQITFTINNVTNSYSFLAQNIVQQTGGLYRISNNTISKTSNTFTSGTANLSYTYSPVFAISSFTGFTESTFVGPTSAGNWDSVIARIQDIGLTNTVDPVSTLTFYNVINGPITSNQTSGMTIEGTVVFNGVQYSSTFTVTNQTSAQIFRI
jgi:hypothetical protein